MDINRRVSFLQNVSIFPESAVDLLCQIAENVEEMEFQEGFMLLFHPALS